MLATTNAVTYAAFGVAAYGAFLSTVLAARQIWQGRRRLRVIAQTIAWSTFHQDGHPVLLELLEVRAIGEGTRPVHVQHALVLTEDGRRLHPSRVVPPGTDPPGQPMLHDGESVAFYYDLL